MLGLHSNQHILEIKRYNCTERYNGYDQSHRTSTAILWFIAFIHHIKSTKLVRGSLLESEMKQIYLLLNRCTFPQLFKLIKAYTWLNSLLTEKFQINRWTYRNLSPTERSSMSSQPNTKYKLTTIGSISELFNFKYHWVIGADDILTYLPTEVNTRKTKLIQLFIWTSVTVVMKL